MKSDMVHDLRQAYRDQLLDQTPDKIASDIRDRPHHDDRNVSLVKRHPLPV